jgi:hypothetical protein
MYIILFLGCANVQPDTMLLAFQREVLASSMFLSEEGGSKFIRNFFYSSVHDFWPVVLAELADGPTGCAEVARLGVYLLANLVGNGQLCLRRRIQGLDQTCRCTSTSLHAYRLKISPAKNHELHYTRLYVTAQKRSDVVFFKYH